MWFLQIDIMVRLLLACAVVAVLSVLAHRYFKQSVVMRLMVVFDLLLLLYVSKRLVVFYIGYVLVTYLLVLLIGHVKKFRKGWFVLCCFACSIPFFYTRMTEFFSFLPVGVVMVGIAYNMLKAIDAVFFVYYAEQKIPFLTYANYMLFFPVLTAGPIFRYRDFVKTYENPDPITAPLIEKCIKRIIRGLFKKMVAQVFVGQLMLFLAGGEMHFYVSFAVAALSYLMLFLDMSGYADIAIGIGGIMGIRVPENFKKPLKAASFTQFWRNWHVTLSDWIREHIFVVIKGRRLERTQGAVIGFCTMMFMSLWHGFSWLFVIDGIFNGLVLGGENLFGLTTVDKRKSSKAYYVFRCFLTNFIFAVNTLFFTLSPEQILSVLKGFVSL